MASVIFVILIVVISVVTTMTKQKQQKQKKQEGQEYVSSGSYSEPDAHRRPVSSYRYYQKKENSMKRRANSVENSAYGTDSCATKKAAARAVEHMKEQEYKTRPSAQEFRQMAGVEIDDGAILSAAKMHSLAAELSNEYDSKEDLMAPVFDLMVKGPDTSIPNERDFVSEGMDMINSYTLEV